MQAKIAKRTNGHSSVETVQAPASNGRTLHQNRRGKQAKRNNSREMAPAAGVSKIREVMARTALHLIGAGRLVTPAAVGVTSTIPGEGRTTAALALAISIAEQTSSPTLLVEGDLYRPVLTALSDGRPGMSLDDYLAGRCSLSDAVVESGRPHLSSIVASSHPDDETTGVTVGSRLTELRMRIPQMRAVLQEDFDYIIFDLPSMLEDINLEFITRQLDGTFFVIRSGMATREEIDEAFSLLDPEKVLSVLLTGEPSRVPHWIKQFMNS